MKPPKLIRPTDVLFLLGFGWYFAACLVLGTFGGYWLDRTLDTKPWFTVGGLLLGTVLGFYGMYRMIRPLLRSKVKPKK